MDPRASKPPLLRVSIGSIAVALLTASPAAAAGSPSLMTSSNAAPPAVGGGRVFWAEEHGRQADVRMAAPGGTPKTIFRLTGPRARSARLARHGIRNRHPDGTRWQRAGTFAVDADGIVRWRHVPAHAGD